MKSIVSLMALFAVAGCGSDGGAPDAAADLATPRDLSAMGHCLPSTPPSILNEGACAIAPPNGYCFVDSVQPTF